MEEQRQKHEIAPGVFLRTKRALPFGAKRKLDERLLPKLNPVDFPRAMKIARVERLVGRRVYTPDS